MTTDLGIDFAIHLPALGVRHSTHHDSRHHTTTDGYLCFTLATRALMFMDVTEAPEASEEVRRVGTQMFDTLTQSPLEPDICSSALEEAANVAGEMDSMFFGMAGVIDLNECTLRLASAGCATALVASEDGPWKRVHNPLEFKPLPPKNARRGCSGLISKFFKQERVATTSCPFTLADVLLCNVWGWLYAIDESAIPTPSHKRSLGEHIQQLRGIDFVPGHERCPLGNLLLLRAV